MINPSTGPVLSVLLRQQLEALKQQKKGLMQKLLTGEVRVPPLGKGARCYQSILLEMTRMSERQYMRLGTP